MQKTITAQNLRLLIDALLKEGNRVIGPKQAGTMTLYEPLASGDELTLGMLPRRSAKETFFPLSEPLLAFEKNREGTTVTDVDTGLFPETVLVGALPCDAAAPQIMDAVFSWDYQDEFYLQRRRRTTIIGLACTAADDACFCTMVGLSPSETEGLRPLPHPHRRGRLCLHRGDRQGGSALQPVPAPVYRISPGNAAAPGAAGRQPGGPGESQELA